MSLPGGCGPAARKQQEDMMKHSLWVTSEYGRKVFLETREISLCYVGMTDTDMTHLGWTKVGTVELSNIEIMGELELIESAIASLRTEIKNVKAEAHKKVMELEDFIGKLQSLPFKENGK